MVYLSVHLNSRRFGISVGSDRQQIKGIATKAQPVQELAFFGERWYCHLADRPRCGPGRSPFSLLGSRRQWLDTGRRTGLLNLLARPSKAHFSPKLIIAIRAAEV